MNLTLKVILGALATFRIARMVAKEDGPFFIFNNLRKYTDFRRLEEQNEATTLEELGIPAKPKKLWFSLDEGVRCPYCMGVWVSFFFAILQPNLGFRDKVTYAFGVCGMQAILQLIEDRYL